MCQNHIESAAEVEVYDATEAAKLMLLTSNQITNLPRNLMTFIVGIQCVCQCGTCLLSSTTKMYFWL